MRALLLVLVVAASVVTLISALRLGAAVGMATECGSVSRDEITNPVPNFGRGVSQDPEEVFL